MYQSADQVWAGLGSAISLDEWNQQPQINDRFNLSYQRKLIWGTIFEGVTVAMRVS